MTQDKVDDNGRRPTNRRLTFLLIVALSLLYVPQILSQEYWAESYIKGDSYYYRAAIISLLEDGDLLVANNVAYDPLNGQLAVGRNGLVPKHPLLLSLLGLPFYLAFGSPGLLLLNVLMSLALMVVLWRFNQLFLDAPAAWITTLLYAVGSLFYYYVYNFSPDVLATLLVLTGVYWLLTGRSAAAALLLGLAIFAKPLNLVPVGLLSLYFLWTQVEWDGRMPTNVNWRQALCFAGSLFLGVLPFLALNYWLFGSPFVTGYQRIAVPGDAAGAAAVATHVNDFTQPLLLGLYLVLFYPNKGILMTNPLLLLALPAALRWSRLPRPRELALLALISAVLLLVVAKYDHWYLSHFSNRFLMLTVIFSAPFSGWTVQTIGRRYGLLP